MWATYRQSAALKDARWWWWRRRVAKESVTESTKWFSRA